MSRKRAPKHIRAMRRARQEEQRRLKIRKRTEASAQFLRTHGHTGLVSAERVCVEECHQRGFKTYRHGWPDFLVERPDGKFFFIEVKSRQDDLLPSQRTMFEALERLLGIQVFVFCPGKGNVPWRDWTPEANSYVEKLRARDRKRNAP